MCERRFIIQEAPIRVATAKRLVCERKWLCKAMVLVSAKKHQCLANQSGLISSSISDVVSLQHKGYKEKNEFIRVWILVN